MKPNFKAVISAFRKRGFACCSAADTIAAFMITVRLDYLQGMGCISKQISCFEQILATLQYNIRRDSNFIIKINNKRG